MYHKVPCTLTKAQFHKIKSGGTIQLAHHQIGEHGKHWLALHPETVKKIHRNHRKGKGVRIHVSPHEMEASGEGLMDFWNKIKDAGNWIKDKVIDTPFYQQTIKPLAKQGVNQLIDNFVPAAARNAAHQGADFVGDKTGAFGLKPKRKAGRPKKHAKSRGGDLDGGALREAIGPLSERDHALIRLYANSPVMDSGKHIPKNINEGYHLSQDMSRLISPTHPASWPVSVNLAPIGGALKRRNRGGSFLPA